jgi:hypothetical protein
VVERFDAGHIHARVMQGYDGFRRRKPKGSGSYRHHAGFLFPGFLPFGGLMGQIISATLGALILMFAIGLVKRAL